MEKENFSPKEVLSMTLANGVNKTKLKTRAQFFLGVLAGMYIAFGGVSSTIVNNLGKGFNPQITKILVGLTFTIGIVAVVVGGAELFTGNILMFGSTLDKKTKLGNLLYNWLKVYLYNFIGALLIVAIVFYSNILSDGTKELFVNIYNAKTSQGFLELFVKGIGCNILVCLSVWLATASKEITAKVFASAFPVAIFIICGFEHCVANMFYIPAGMMAASAYGIAAEGLNIGTFILNNLIPATIGNIFGGVIVVGFLYWYLFLREKN